MAALTPGTAHSLADLAPLAEGAVVSRVLLKQKSGSVTLFAFDAGEGLSEHTAPFDALVLITSGSANVRIADVEHQLETGETIVLPANIPHALHAEEAFQMLLVMLRAPKED